MTKLNLLVRSILSCCFLLFATNQFAFSQVKDEPVAAISKDSAISILNTMPPEQLQALIVMAMNSLPPEKKGNVEETLMTLKSKTPEVKTINLKNKTVSFVPLSHASTPEFYNGVRDVVKEYKSKGYVVYYEQLKSKAEGPSNDTLKLKLRKIIGLDPNRQTYTIVKKFFPDVIVQPEYKDLGITRADVNADVTVKQLIDRYQQLYGQVSLTQCDFDTKVETTFYSCGKLSNNLDPVILDYRNEFVAGLIKSSGDKKILVLYGARHIPGMMELIGER